MITYIIEPDGLRAVVSSEPQAAVDGQRKLKAAHIELGGVDYTPDPGLCHHGQRSGVCCACKPW